MPLAPRPPLLSPSYFLHAHAALPRFPQRGQHFPGSRTPPPGGLGKVLGSLVPFERRASTCTDKTFRGPSRSPRSLLPREGLTKRFQHAFVPELQQILKTPLPTTTWREQLLPLADCLLAGERGSKVRRQSLSGRRRPARRLRLLCRADQGGSAVSVDCVEWTGVWWAGLVPDQGKVVYCERDFISPTSL